MDEDRSLLLLRYGELWLKSPEVQRRFMDRLLSNIGEQFRGAGIFAKVSRSRDRIFVGVDWQNLDSAKQILSHTFGLVSFSCVSKINAGKQEVLDAALSTAKETIRPGETFAIRAQRTGKHEYTSNELERECGAQVVRHLGNKVNLTKPDKTVYVEVRDSEAYIFSEKISAAGGLPLGVEGKVVSEFDGHPEQNLVASYVMMKRGCRVLPVFAKDGAEAKKAVAFLKRFDPNVKSYFSGVKKIDAFAIAICRKKGAEAIILSGSATDICGSKAGKTFDKKSGIPYLYPLVGYDEEEIGALFKNLK